MASVHPLDSVSSANPDRKAALGEALRRRILTMQIAPGAVLDEVALSEEFGLSRPPVRELLRQMAGEGYIDLEANRAARVTSMNYDSLRQFFLVAPMIYVATTKLAAQVATPSDVLALKGIQRDFRAAIEGDDLNGRIFNNNEFHLRIGTIARNDYLLPSLRRLLIDHARIARTFFGHDPLTRGDLEVSAREHDQMIEAIERRDAEDAGQIVITHLDASRRNMAAYAAPAGMRVPGEI